MNFYNSYGELSYQRCGLKKCYMYMRYSSPYKNFLLTLLWNYLHIHWIN